jgi:hypothetical protein
VKHYTLESVLTLLPGNTGKWPALSKPINALDNTTLAKAQSAATRDGQVAELTELPEYLALTVDAARSCA